VSVAHPHPGFDLTGRLAVVTGASRGLGLAIARTLARAGADIVGVSATMSASGAAVREAVEGAGRSFLGIETDLADREQLAGLVQQLGSLDRPVDVLVNNAGTIAREPAVTHTTADWDRVLQVNLTSPFVLAREVGAGMLMRGQGKIVFVASLLSFQGGITVPGYAASKSGVAGLTKALANEWAAHGVNVNAVAPGYVETDNTHALRADPDRNRAILERIPAGRWGRPEDVVGAVLFLSTSASDYVHGTVIPVDGGWLAR
jgi:2-dehydro-3-deoxy-D-gluconate 5-dehydrogenase